MIGPGSPLGLGSASPRRRALIEALGIPLIVVSADVDERPRENEAATTYLERVVADKLRAVVADARSERASVVLVADTIVLFGSEILGKPKSAEHARAMLTQLSGCTHEVRTRFALGVAEAAPGDAVAGKARRREKIVHAETVITTVEFRSLDRREIDGYVATGEGLDKAGAYAIQGIASFAVRRIQGSYANVVGLPVCEVVLALKRTGFLGVFP